MVQCVLLFGVPINRNDYFQRIEKSDYLQRYRSNPEEYWQAFYDQSVAQPFGRLATKVQEQEWQVYPQATLADLTQVSQKAQAIVLVSHWKNYAFSNNDFFQPIKPDNFASAVDQANGPLARWLAHAFYQHRIDRDDSSSDGVRDWVRSIQQLWEEDKTIRDILEEALDAPLENEITLPDGVEYSELDLTRRTRRRNVMDALFSRLLHPGNRLELFDGLHDCSTVAQAIAPTFKGVLDLTSCTSTALADHISIAHQYRFRVVQFSQNQDPVWAATALTATMRLMVQGYDYLDARRHGMQLVRTVARRRIRAKMESSQ